MTHKELVDVAYRWVLNSGRCGVAFKELKTICWEIPDVIGFGTSGFSVVIECKASRSDFFADREKPFRKNPELGMGSNRFYCCPTGLIKVDELPKGWGLIYVNEGKSRLAHNPLHEYSGYKARFLHEKNSVNEHSIMYSALRRLFLKGYLDHIYDPIEDNIISQKQPHP